MDSSPNLVCPVCMLYLRPGITLENHLTSHPKQKVIEALVKISQLTPQSFEKLLSSATDLTASTYTPLPVTSTPTWTQPTPLNVTQMPPSLNQVPTNHSFIYQQFMSSSATQPLINVNPALSQQFVAVPTVINPHMFCSPYVFQQQQQLQIVSTNPNLQQIIPRPPIGLLNSELSITATPNVLTSEAATSPVSPKHVHISTSTDTDSIEENTDENKTNEVQNDNDNEQIQQTEETNKDESVQVYPLYPEVIMTEEYNVRQSDTPEITIVIEKNCETIDNGEQTEIGNEVEIDTNDVNKIDDEVTITIESNAHDIISMPIIIAGKNDEELNKACQTTQATNMLKKQETEIVVIENDQKVSKLTATLSNETSVDSIFTSSKTDNCIVPSSSNSNLLTQNSDNVTLLEIDDMNFMISNDYIQTGKTVLSKVEDYECIKDTNNDGNKIIMNIGEEKIDRKEFNRFSDGVPEDNILGDNLNIHADERMPPRGELSEQESNEASDIHSWGRVYQEQECSSGMSTSYDLLARESWEASDCSDTEMPPLQSRIPPPCNYSSDKELDTVSSLKKPPIITYNCTTCGETFSCPKERRVHQSKEHGSTSAGSVKKVLKIRQVRKTKQSQHNAPEQIAHVKVENNFDLFAKSELLHGEANTNEPMSPVKMEGVIGEPPVDVKPMKTDDFLCNMCGELFTTLKDFNRHLQKDHKILNEKHKCKTCQEQFTTEGKFTEHLKIHPLECNLCGKNFYRRYNLYIHLKRHYNIRPHKCETCGKSFLTRQKLQEHTNVHTRVAPIKCTMCDETFRRHSNLVQHRNKHHFNIKKKYKDYVCHCGEVFHSKNKLNWHKEIHDTKPKSCTYCHEKFIHMSSLTRHIRRSHNQNYVPNGKKNTENVECHICKGIYFKSSLEVHLQIHSGRRQHACLICGKEFTTKWNLKLHRWTHASRTSKPFKCDQCNGAFIRQSDYQAHLNSHKSIRPYTCNYCGCKFIRKYNCQRHVREHEEGKSYTCTICNKSFHRSYYLKEHLRVHSGARPFSCHICGKTSTTKSNHNKHMKIHHAREPVSTEG